MDTYVPHYFNGGSVHVGDRVRYKEQPGNVVFVSNGEGGEFAPGYADYLGYEPGIMVLSDDGEMMFIIIPDEHLELVRPRHEAPVSDA